ncbi:MAG: type II secretion system protein GspC, partial [Pseudobdellovibrio sp.]
MKKLNQEQKKRIQKWAIYGLILFIGFVTADLAVIYMREYFIPNQAPPKKAPQDSSTKYIDRSQYTSITNRNIFSSNGTIPDALTAKNEDGSGKSDVPVPSSLPLNLIGTLVHSNPDKSVAAVEVKSKNMTGSYMVGAEIEGIAKVEKIERGILYLRNNNNGALEYIELNKGNNKVNFDASKVSTSTAKPQGSEIQQVDNNTFRVKRADLNKYLNNLSSLLMQARAIPETDKNTGEIKGFRLVDFQNDSIFAQLGIPRGTLIKSANGEPITSVQDAMGLFNKFKTGNKIELGVEVNGSDQKINY